MMPLSPIRYGSKVLPPSDPYYSYVVSLLHFDGANNATTYTDETGKAWVNNGLAKLSSDYSKFGATSLYCAGGISPQSYIVCSDAHFTTNPILAQDFCIEMFVLLPSAWLSNNSTYKGIAGFANVLREFSIVQWRVGSGSELGNFAGVIGGSGANEIPATFTPAINTWYHLALTRSGNTLRFFVDGSLIGTRDVTGVSIPARSPLWIGHIDIDTNYYPFMGYIDEFRLTVGVPRYTSGFTPPTEAFPYP